MSELAHSPAFPNPERVLRNPAAGTTQDILFTGCIGMTYRQWLAGTIMAGFASFKPSTMEAFRDNREACGRAFAQVATAYADALIAELEKTDG